MEVDTMWLDCLPRKKDIISQYIYLRRDREMNFISRTNPELVTMTARAVKYIWEEAQVPSMPVNDILKAVEGLLKEFRNLLLTHDASLFLDLPRDLYAVYARMVQCSPNLFSSLMNSDVMTELFDVLVSGSTQNYAFYQDQKCARKMKTETRLGQQCLKGADVYYKQINQKGSLGEFEEPHQIDRNMPPTQLDVIKYVHSRMALREMSHSAGPGFYYTNVLWASNDVSRLIDSIWLKIYGKDSYCGLSQLRRRVSRLLKVYNEHAYFRNITIQNAHMGLGSQFHTFDNDAFYRVMLQEHYEQEIFNGFAFKNSSSLSIKLKFGEKLSKIAKLDSEVEKVQSIKLIVPDFLTTVWDAGFCGDTWLSHVDDTPTSSKCPNSDWDIGHEQSCLEDPSSLDCHLKDAAVQTACSIQCSHQWFHDQE